jgi:hypothetical protein
MPLFRLNGRLVFFAHVPKTGGTSILQSLQQVGAAGLHRDGGHGALPPQHWHARIYNKLLPPALYDYGFMVVRDPYDRLFSEYRMAAARAGAGRPSFAGWVNETLERYPRDRGMCRNHLRPQHKFHSPHLAVFRFEDGLQRVVDAVTSYAGCPVTPAVTHANRSPGAEIAASPETLQRVAAFYREDFRRFGYDDDPRAALDRHRGGR